MRGHNPWECGFSCFSSSHNTLSCIDLAMGNGEVISWITDICYGTWGLSDHLPLFVTMGRAKNAFRCFCKINPYWLPLIIGHDIMKSQLRMFFIENIGSASPLVVRDCLRGLLIAEISQNKKDSGKQEKLSIAMVMNSERNYILDHTLSNIDKWIRVQEQHKLFYRILRQAERKRFFSSQPYFVEGENTGHYN